MNECIPEKVSFNLGSGWMSSISYYRIGKKGFPERMIWNKGPGDTVHHLGLDEQPWGGGEAAGTGWTYDLGHVTWKGLAVSYWRHWGFNPSHGIAEALEKGTEEGGEKPTNWKSRNEPGWEPCLSEVACWSAGTGLRSCCGVQKAPGVSHSTWDAQVELE